MRKDITVVAEPRSSRGKNEAIRMRAAGSIPAIVYGAGQDPVPVKVNPKEINKILHSATGHNTIFNVQIETSTTPAMVVDWQHHPVKGSLLHVDLKRIDLSRRLNVKVPVHLHGEPFGVKTEGGLLEIVNREIEIECLPDDIPEAFNMDVTAMQIGSAIRAGEVPLTASMKLVSPADLVVVHVVALRAAAAEEAAATEGAAAAAEPEVIKKGKKEEEGAEEKKK
ncbi:MAG TPA: 50S ribosomal protein L25 [Solibacterales bacterium]|nr:50S ribosomal protein L25 [Bryobacterales bacterium]